jgi:TonB family protein
MAVTVHRISGWLGANGNRLVVTRTAAQLRMGDRHVDSPAVRPGLLALLAALGLATGPAGAAPWPACNAPSLTPPGALHRPPPEYPESARLAGAEGFVDVAYTVLTDGNVGWTRVRRAEPSGFFEPAAVDGLRAWRFRPALLDGRPVECRGQTRLRFTLTDSVPARPQGSTAVGDQPAPVYPEQARIEGLEGYVEVEFEAGEDGRVTRAEVTLAMPRGDFERAALAAVRSWRVPPQAAGRSVRRFEFALPALYPHDPSPTLFAAAPFPEQACREGTAGRVRLEVEVAADGRVNAARVIDGEPAGLYDTTALAVARSSRIPPAWRGGVPIASTGLLTLRFEPDAERCGGLSPAEPQGPARRAPAPRVSALGRR